jgi:acyl-CoA synthetase (AMP-forming)/AMP-acid ligase II
MMRPELEPVYECLGDALDAAARDRGSRVGWTFERQHVSFGEMKERADTVARSLMQLGIGPGDVVAVWISNLVEFAACLFGCAKIGAIVTAINTRSKLFELQHVLGHSEAKVLLTVDRFLNQDFLSMLQELLGPQAIKQNGRVVSKSFPDLRQLVAAPGIEVAALLPWRDFLRLGRAIPSDALARAQQVRRCTEPVLLQYTSGTTALPKGALCSHVYVRNFGMNHVIRLGVQPGEGFLNTQPFYHVGGSCGAVPVPITTECHTVVPEYYEPARVLRLIEQERCVARTGFAAMYLMEMEHPRFKDFDLSSLRAGWCVGPPELMEQVRDRMGIAGLVQIYGATEACGTSGTIEEPWDKRVHTCGRSIPGMEMAAFDIERWQRLPPGESGEIAMRGWCTMNGYLKQAEATAAAKDKDGWVHTGDYGMVDDQGYLHFQGRLKNMIRVGGENVSAEEVEAMLMRHPKVKMAAAIPAPDARLDEVVMAIVELKAGAQTTDLEIIEFCKTRMANFRVPRIVHFIDEWPMTGSGKIQKHALIERFSGRAASIHQPRKETRS